MRRIIALASFSAAFSVMILGFSAPPPLPRLSRAI